jgi:hypothetical protein
MAFISIFNEAAELVGTSAPKQRPSVQFEKSRHNLPSAYQEFQVVTRYNKQVNKKMGNVCIVHCCPFRFLRTQ